MRMNYYAVRGLMARMMLWQGKKKEALEAAVEVIEHAPYSWVSQAAVSNPTLKDRDMIFVDEHLFTLNVIKLGDLINSYLDPTINNNYELLYQSKTVADGIYENQQWGRSIGLPVYVLIRYFGNELCDGKIDTTRLLQ